MEPGGRRRIEPVKPFMKRQIAEPIGLVLEIAADQQGRRQRRLRNSQQSNAFK